MTCQLIALCLDSNDPLGLARFWSGVLGWELVNDPETASRFCPATTPGSRSDFFRLRSARSARIRCTSI